MEGNLYLMIDSHNGKKSLDQPSRVLFALKDKMKSEQDRLEGLQMLRKVKRAYILGVKYCRGRKAQWKIEDLHRFCPPESGTESITLPITCDRGCSTSVSRC